MTLYEMTGAWLQLMEMMEDPDADPKAVQDTLEALDGEIEEKADGYAKVIRQLINDGKALKAEEERIYNRRKSIENNVMMLKSRLEESMRATGKTKFKTQLFSFGIQKNPSTVIIDNPAKVPKNFWIPQEPKFDKNGIKQFLAYNKCDFAHIEQTESLRIR